MSDADISSLSAALPLLVVLIAWSMTWKALALYRAGLNRSPAWFVVLFLVNTLGILEILYLFIWGRKRPPAQA